VENWHWKRLWTSCKTDCGMNEQTILFINIRKSCVSWTSTTKVKDNYFFVTPDL
jgi:hypothetical protein